MAPSSELSPSESCPDTPGVSTDMNSPFSGGAPRSPSLASTSSLSIKRPLSDAADDDDDDDSPRARAFDDSNTYFSDLPDDYSGDPADIAKRAFPVCLRDTEDVHSNVNDSKQLESLSSTWDTQNWQSTSSNAPTHEEQISIIKELFNVSMNEGETWYIVASDWWKNFLNDANPGPVDNSTIVDNYGSLKPRTEVEFEIVPEQVWERIVEWYGEHEDSYSIARTAVNTSTGSSNIEVEVYPPVFKLHHLANSTARSNEDSMSVPSLSMSRTSLYSDLESAVKQRLDIKNETIIRIWKLNVTPKNRLDVESFKQLVDKELIDQQSDDKGNDDKNTLGYLGLSVNASLVIEEKSPFSGEWVSERKSYISPSMSTRINGFGRHSDLNDTGPRSMTVVPKSRKQQHYRAYEPRTKGTMGLSNLGNTCYMNSALQCLSHVKELTQYFLVGAYKDELNPSNPLGMDGKVAIAYSELLQNLFNSKSSSSYFTPREMKSIVGKYGPMFSGYGQHDSQEFLAFLLDGLHEDLNRILKKPYTEKPELPDDKVSSKDAVVELADKCWELHRMRNDSVIQDLFAGMYKSTLVCPVCNKVSITFDPYMDLTLPLPIDNTWSKEVVFVPYAGRPVKVDIELNGGSSVKEFKEALGKIVEADPRKFVSVTAYNHKLFNVHMDNELIADKVDTTDDAIVYEIDIPIQEADDLGVTIVPVLSKKLERAGSNIYGPGLFGYPFLITLTTSEMANFDIIYNKIVEKYKGMSTSKTLAAWGSPDKDNNGESNNIELGTSDRPEIFTLKVAKMGYRRQYHGNKIPIQWSVEDLIDVRERFNKLQKPKRVIADPPRYVQSVANDTDEYSMSSAEADEELQRIDVSVTAPAQSIDTDGESLVKSNHADAVIDADDQWEETNRNSVSDIEMQDASDKENNLSTLLPEDDPIDDENSSDDPGVSSLFDNENLEPHSMSYGPSPNPFSDNWKDDVSPVVSYVQSGETFVCEWTDEAYDVCFGATDGKDSFRGMPTWETMDKRISKDVLERRAKKASKKDQTITLDDCLNLFAKPEVLGEDDLWYCPNCKKHQQAVKTFEIWSIPDVFAIHLKRFSSTSRRDKIDVKIDFPIEGLNLSGRVGNPKQADNPNSLIYDLFAVDNHYGGLGGGHYTAYVKNFVDNKWYYFDDSSVREVQAEESVTAAAYLLFYRRRSATPLGGDKIESLISKEMESDNSLSADIDDVTEAASISSSDRDYDSTSSQSPKTPPPYSEALPNGSDLVPLSVSPSSSEESSSAGISSARFPGEGHTLGGAKPSDNWRFNSSTSWPSSASVQAYNFSNDSNGPERMAFSAIKSGKNNTLSNTEVMKQSTNSINGFIVSHQDDLLEPLTTCDTIVPNMSNEGEEVVEIKPESFTNDDDYEDEGGIHL
ncbi:hypothetical protein V1511DRAFT_521020 [Dipodascopsis uninucleata]